MPDLFIWASRSSRRSWRTWILLACLLAGCQPALTPSVQPTPYILVAQVTPALESLSPQFHACAEELPSIGLVVVNTPASSLNTSQAAVALRWGMRSKPEGYAAEIGQESLAVIVSKGNPLSSIQLSDLQAIYQGKMKSLPGTSSEMSAWTYPVSDDAAQVFESVILNGGGIASRALYTAPDPQAMLEAVAKDPNAVGYLPRRWLNDSIRALNIQDLDTSSLSQPVVALSKSEPEGPEKSWLLCLQASFK